MWKTGLSHLSVESLQSQAATAANSQTQVGGGATSMQPQQEGKESQNRTDLAWSSGSSLSSVPDLPPSLVDRVRHLILQNTHYLLNVFVSSVTGYYIHRAHPQEDG